MKISHLAFDKFYNVILEHFRNNALTPEERERESPKSATNWEASRNNAFNKLFGLYTKDTRKFYRLRGEIRSESPNDGYVDDDLFIVALKFIGIEIPNEIKKAEIADDEKKVQVYYQYFLKSHYPEFLERNPHLQVYDEGLNKLIFPKDNISITNSRFSYLIGENEIYGNMNIDIIKAVNDFYQNISTSKYDEAWNGLSATMRKRVWNDKFETFEIGYTNSIAVNNVHIWDVKAEIKTATCKIYYEDVVNTYTTVELGNIEKLTIGYLDEFIRKLNSIKEKASKTSLVNFDKIEIQKFFEPANSEYIWYKCGMKPEAIKELYDSEAVLCLPRIYNISLVKTDDSWQITGITPIKSFLHR